jgi:hypothetical protein
MSAAHTQPQTAPPIAITGCSLASVAGDHPRALHAALATGLAGLAAQTERYAIGDENPLPSPVTAAPLALAGHTLNLQLSELLLRALSPLTEAIEPEEPPPALLILLPLDQTYCARARRVDPERIRSNLTGWLPQLATTPIDFQPYTQGATAALQNALQKLETGETETLLLCGADNLVNALSYNQLAGQNRLATESHGEGVVPGTAAGAIRFQRPSNGENAPPILAKLAGIGSAEEPQAGKAAEHRLEGTYQALTQATGHNPALLQQAATLIQAHNLGSPGEREWHQVAQRLWPIRLDEQQRVAMMLGEIDAPEPAPSAEPKRFNLNQVTGETGAAALPLQLALACERFRYTAEITRYGFPTPSPALVCEMSDYPRRGALALVPPQEEPPPGEASPRQSPPSKG